MIIPLPFSFNWNNKIHCKAFTTLRLHQPNKYIVGNTYFIHLKGDPIKHAEIIAIKTILLKDINPFIAFIDTGYSVDECKKIIQRMYKNSNWETQKIDFILLKSL